MLVDEEVVLATLKVEVTAVSLIGKEYLLPIGHVAPHAHVAASTEGEAEQAQLLLQRVEHIAAVCEAAATFVVAVAKYHICGVGEMACEAGKPLAACGVAVGLGEYHPLLLGCFYAEHQGQLLVAEVADAVRGEGGVEVRVALAEVLQQLFGVVLRIVVYHNHLKVGVLLLQYKWQMLCQ